MHLLLQEITVKKSSAPAPSSPVKMELSALRLAATTTAHVPGTSQVSTVISPSPVPVSRASMALRA